jgi:MurNAc alpha-1-phosphate uridylyltransferase
MYSVAILAGGLATRLRPITEVIPKALVQVAGRPFICHQLDYLKKQGVTSVVLCVGYLGDLIQEVVADGASWDIDVKYSIDGDVLLGTGGAIKRAIPLLGKNFFILYGDSYLPINFQNIQNAFFSCGKSGLLTILKNQNKWDKSNVVFLDGSLLEYNKFVPNPKMCHIDYGLSVLSAATLDRYPESTPFDLADVYHELSCESQLYGLEVFDRFYEIGSHQGIAETEEYLLTLESCI